MNKINDYIKALSKNDKKTLSQKALKTCEEVGAVYDTNVSHDINWIEEKEEIKYCYCGAKSCGFEPGFDLCEEHLEDV